MGKINIWLSLVFIFFCKFPGLFCDCSIVGMSGKCFVLIGFRQFFQVSGLDW